MRLVYAADLHSDEPQYSALLDLVECQRPDALILGGDLFAYSAQPGPQLDFARRQLLDFFRSVAVDVLWIPGNTDWFVAVAAIERYAEELPSVSHLPVGPHLCCGLRFAGYPFVPPSPFRIKHWERRDQTRDVATLTRQSYAPDASGELLPIGADYLATLPSIEDDLGALNACDICVFHAPPFGGDLDVVTQGNSAGAPGGAHVGSRAVRAAIERIQPALSLHGHIHESPRISGRWAERIGRTLAVNPGREDRLCAVTAELDPQGGMLRLQHTLYGDCDR